MVIIVIIVIIVIDVVDEDPIHGVHWDHDAERTRAPSPSLDLTDRTEINSFDPPPHS